MVWRRKKRKKEKEEGGEELFVIEARSFPGLEVNFFFLKSKFHTEGMFRSLSYCKTFSPYDLINKVHYLYLEI